MNVQRCRMAQLLCCACAALMGASSAVAIGVAGQRIAAEATVVAVPEPLRGFYQPHVDGVVERTLEPDMVWRDDARTRSRDDWHYLALDAAAGAAAGWPERLEAVRTFPTRQNAARRLLSEHNVKQGGELPWQLTRLADELVDAFRSGDRQTIVRCTGNVIHFAMDAADPFAATCDRRAEAAGNAVLASAEVGDRLFAHQDAAQRIGWELVRRNAERYRSALAPEEVRFELNVDDVPFAVIECMVESFARLEGLCSADREIMARMDLIGTSGVDSQDFLARADEYYRLLDQRCGDVCVDNLRRGVALASTLIVSAWTRAGAPDPIGPPQKSPEVTTVASASDQDTDAVSQGAAAPRAQATPASVSAVAFVASRNSKVYHRSDCAHAKRISEANRVDYRNAAEAEAEGKRPCRTCKPEVVDR